MALLIYNGLFSRLHIIKDLINRDRKIRILTKCFCLLIGLGPFLFFFSLHFFDVRPINIFNSILMGLLVLLFFITLFFLLIRPFIKILIIKFSISTILERKIETIFIALAFFYILASYWGGTRLPEVKKVKVDIKNFPFSNFKIALLADLHLGPILKEDFSRYCVDKVNELNVDLVLIAGDFVESEGPKTKKVLAPFSNIKSRHGIFFVLGNHEIYNDTEKLLSLLPKYGIRPLLNETMVIGSEDRKFNLIGLGDRAGRYKYEYLPDFYKATTGIDSQLRTILLAHRPGVIDSIKQDSNIDLILTGHTHGGQIFPFNLFVRLAEPYISGLHDLNNKTQIYVSEGTGFWGPIIRFLTSSEITLIVIN